MVRKVLIAFATVLLCVPPPGQAEGATAAEIRKLLDAEDGRSPSGGPKERNALSPEQGESLVNNLNQILIAAFGIDPSSREGQNAAIRFNRKNQEPPPFPKPPPAVSRIIKFDGGLPLPSQEKIDAMKRREGEILRQVFEPMITDKKAQEALANRQAEALREYLRPPVLPRCTKNETVSTSMPAGESPSSFGIRDYLLLDRKYPVDPRTAFGENILIVQYSTTEGDIMSAAYGRLDVPCLPYRTRIADNVVYYSMGEDALRNYSNDPHGKGVLDATVVEVLKREDAK